MGDAAGTSVIRLHRRRSFYRDRLRAYRVRIDGNPVAKIAAGATMDFPVPSGEHRVRLTIDQFCSSREVMLQVREGELVEFTCRPGVPWLWGLFPLLFGVFEMMLVFNHMLLWGLFALPLCPVFALLLVRHRYIRLDGPTSYEPSLSTGMLPRSAV
jgi:hypothetical protein